MSTGTSLSGMEDEKTISTTATTTTTNHHGKRSFLAATTATTTLGTSRTDKNGAPLSEKKLRRLEKNRLSARECRRRKREATEHMQRQINLLEGENLRLRLQLQVRRFCCSCVIDCWWAVVVVCFHGREKWFVPNPFLFLWINDVSLFH